jgi:hypothetical protein
MDAKDTAYRLLFISLLHDCLRDNEYCAAHTLVFGLTYADGLANCSFSTYYLRPVYLSYVSHSWKESILDRNLAVSGIYYLILLFNALVTVVLKALFDVFLFILTLFNAASRPRRANVKIITDLRRDGCLFYVVRTCTSMVW